MSRIGIKGCERIENHNDIHHEFSENSDKIDQCISYSHGTMPRDKLIEDLIEGRKTLWKSEDGFIYFIIQIYGESGSRYLNIDLAWGNLKEMKSQIESLYDYAKSLNCRGITAQGRKGWERILQAKNLNSVYKPL